MLVAILWLLGLLLLHGHAATLGDAEDLEAMIEDIGAATLGDADDLEIEDIGDEGRRLAEEEASEEECPVGAGKFVLLCCDDCDAPEQTPEDSDGGDKQERRAAEDEEEDEEEESGAEPKRFVLLCCDDAACEADTAAEDDDSGPDPNEQRRAAEKESQEEVSIPIENRLLKRMFGDKRGLLIKQTMNGFFCNERNEFSVHDLDDAASRQVEDLEAAGPEIMFIKESAGCCLRTCGYKRAGDCCARCCSWVAPGARETAFDVWEQPSDDDVGLSEQWDAERNLDGIEKVLIHKKDCTNGEHCLFLFEPIACLEGKFDPCFMTCCCCLPYLDTFDGNDVKLGRSEYVCDVCLNVPKFRVKDQDDNIQYLIRPDTCCGGCCLLPKCDGPCCGKKCCTVPFYIRDPITQKKLKAQEPTGPPQEDEQWAQITSLWSGVKQVWCLRDDYEIKFPENATPEQKATLMGSCLLIEMTFFEHPPK